MAKEIYTAQSNAMSPASHATKRVGYFNEINITLKVDGKVIDRSEVKTKYANATVEYVMDEDNQHELGDFTQVVSKSDQGL